MTQTNGRRVWIADVQLRVEGWAGMSAGALPGVREASIRIPNDCRSNVRFAKLAKIPPQNSAANKFIVLSLFQLFA
jgi:hypothetical protein